MRLVSDGDPALFALHVLEQCREYAWHQPVNEWIWNGRRAFLNFAFARSRHTPAWIGIEITMLNGMPYEAVFAKCMTRQKNLTSIGLRNFYPEGQMNFRVPAIVTAAAIASATATYASNIVYVLDASNSMWGQIEGTAKIQIAKSALRGMVGDIDESVDISLVAYGHRSAGDCGDIEVMAGLGQADKAQLLAQLDGLQPKGKTPISAALVTAGNVFPTNDAVNQIVLISDGIETCEGDPCQTAQKLAMAGAETRVHAIGFDVDASARAQLECIAKAGKGVYLDASNASGLNDALAEVTRVAATVVAPPPPPPAPEPVVPQRVSAFLDEFEPDMAEEWTVNNPNPDGFIAEGGNLLMLSSSVGGFPSNDTENFMTLPGVLPDGDWDATMTFAGEFKTGRDSLWFGLWKDQDNFLGAQFWRNRSRTNTCSAIGLSLVKHANGEQTKFDVPIMGDFGCGGPGFDEEDAFFDRLTVETSTLTLHKRGRSYHATLAVGSPDADNYIERTTDKLTSLRSPGEIALSLGNWTADGAQGESLIFVDKVEIVSVSE